MSTKAKIILTLQWFANLFLMILKLKKRDKHLWIFGAWEGRNYSDNSKYFFEYVIDNLPHINAVWITSNPEVKEKLRLEGKACYLHNERKGKQIMRNAGFVFYSNGMDDFGNIDYCHGAIKVALWHGMPLKKLWYASNFLKKENMSLYRRLYYYMKKTYSYFQRDITIATSETTKRFFMECFDIPEESVYITGQPRNDRLFDANVKENVEAALNHDKRDNFILYMPTWRESNEQGKPFLNDVISLLYEDTHFLAQLKLQNTKLYIKPHPNVNVKYKSQGNVIIIEHHQHLDAQELLASADILITDYSSAFIDYALLERPIHYYVPDLEEYSRTRHGIFLTFEELADFWFKDIETFKKVVFDDSESNQLGLSNTKKANAIYDDPKLTRGKYCEEVSNIITKLYFS